MLVIHFVTAMKNQFSSNTHRNNNAGHVLLVNENFGRDGHSANHARIHTGVPEILQGLQTRSPLSSISVHAPLGPTEHRMYAHQPGTYQHTYAPQHTANSEHANMHT